jgi:hypothetical protein
LSPSGEPATCEDPSTPCCAKGGACEEISASCSGRAGAVLYGPGESVTVTRNHIGEPIDSEAFISVVNAGAKDLPWAEWAVHAVGLQYCAAYDLATRNDTVFLDWLETRPDLLVSLAATTFPVEATVWGNMEKLWREFRSDIDANPDLGSHLLGFAYMQRKNSVDLDVVTMPYSTAHGDGDVTAGHEDRNYGSGKTPVHGTSCAGHESNFPERDKHPTATKLLRFQLEQSKDPSRRDVDPVAYPWPLVPHGYYPPIRECEWVLENRDKNCPSKEEFPSWTNDMTPPSSNPLCKNSTLHPLSLPRISEDGRGDKGCSYHAFAKASCLGKVAGRRVEPGHSADFIITPAGTGKNRTFSVSSSSAGFKDLNGKIPFPVTLIDTVTEAERSEKWLANAGIDLDLQSLAEAVSNGHMPRYDVARLAGMFAEHAYWYVDEDTRAKILKPLAQRAMQLNPKDTNLWRLVFKLNSKRKSYPGRSREADQAFKGVVYTSTNSNLADSVQTYLNADPKLLARHYQTCFDQQNCDPITRDYWVSSSGQQANGTEAEVALFEEEEQEEDGTDFDVDEDEADFDVDEEDDTNDEDEDVDAETLSFSVVSSKKRGAESRETALVRG